MMFGAPDSFSHSTLVKSIVATNKKIPLEQRAHFYTGASPVCALCEADSPDDGSPGCFASLRSEQGAAPLAASPIPAYLSSGNGFDVSVKCSGGLKVIQENERIPTYRT